MNNRNPGMLAVTGGVALGVLFALLAFTGALPGRTGFGLTAVCLATAALIYVFYARTSAVARAGYGALLFLIAVAFIIPFLLVNQQQAQATNTNSTYDQTLQRGAALFGQYCASCHGYQGQGLKGPKLNNDSTVAKFSDDDIRRIISGGIPGDPANPTKLSMPAWLDQYGGPLTEEDIGYLVTLIRSSEPAYRATQGLENVNGFDYVLASLTNPTAIAEYHIEQKGGNKPPSTSFTDMSKQKTVALKIDNDTAGGTPGIFTPQNIVISVGTTVTWTNLSSLPHTVVTRPGFTVPQSFASSVLAASSGTFTFTFTKPGEYPYYCSIHPVMVGWITVQ